MLFDPNKWKMPEVAPAESETVEVLKEARSGIALGWCQNSGCMAGARCSLIAITRARGGNHDSFLRGMSDPALGFFKRAIGTINIVKWNDAPGRTQAEVIAAFDRAIDLARREQS